MRWDDQVWDRVDEAVEQWERSPHSPEPGGFQQLLPPASDPARIEVLATLVKIDQEHRWRTGNRCHLELYLDRWPELNQDSQRVAELLVAECRTRMTSGERPCLTDLKKRFPACADQAWENVAKDRDTGEGGGDRTLAPADSAESGEEDTIPQPHHDDIAVAGAPGTRMGHYRILKRLGGGGMGSVYLAEHETLKRKRALKVLHPWVFPPTPDGDALLDEARKAAQLDHPSIVRVFDAGRTEGGTSYFVMEYLEGTSLAQRIAKGDVSVGQAAAWTEQLAGALQYAHQHGFVHRDIKPANIVIDTSDRARLMDFGLAIHESEQLWRAGEESGTLPYMAPEQVRGETHLLDGRADLWSLGVVLYEMLAGRRPFQAESREDLRKTILTRPPRPLRQINEKVPAELEDVCLRCLKKWSSERYTSASELAESLRHLRNPRSRFPGAGIIALLAASVVTVAASILALNGPSRQVPEMTSPVVRSLDGSVDVSVYSKTDEARWGLSIHQQSARPLHADDLIRITAALHEPAYVYLVWIDARGEAAPVYPWEPGNWLEKGRSRKVDRISLPEKGDGGWPIIGQGGMETIMLLARREPLPNDVDLQGLLADLPQQPMQDPRSLVWFKNGEVVSGRHPSERTRGPQWFRVEEIDHPVYRAQRQIFERLKDHFELIVANSFAFEGIPDEAVP